MRYLVNKEKGNSLYIGVVVVYTDTVLVKSSLVSVCFTRGSCDYVL